jgi:ribosomal protein S12 methylthiotransferase accessory factor
LVIDTTHPLLGIPAAYVIVPGAHFLERTRDTDAVQHSARTLLQGRPPADAMQWMRRLLDIFGPRYDLTFFLAHSLELQERPAEALEVFEKALTQQPDPREVASVHVHIGACRKDLGQYRKALDALQAAEEHNPELKEIYNLRGFCHYRLKEHHEAIAAFERALELDPGSAIDYANIGSNLRELGHKKEAVKLYRMALELDSSIDFARWNLEKLEAELKD